MKLSTVLMPILLCPLTAVCHPGSGIAADAQGNVFFMDTGAGVWRLQQSGALHKVPGRAYHWLALDRTGRLVNTVLPTFNEGSIERTQHNLLLSSDFPLTVDSHGALYFPRKQNGRLHLFRLDPTGSVSTFATIAERRDGAAPGWINGSVVGSDGALYYTEDHGVWKIPAGRQAVAIPIDTSKLDCRSIPGLGTDEGAPMFQGIAVDEQGNVFVAATGCRSVIKIDRDNIVTTIVKTTDTWSPTGVTTFGGDLYVLEYLHTTGHDRREWIPRIRKLAADGSETIVATVERK